MNFFILSILSMLGTAIAAGIMYMLGVTPTGPLIMFIFFFSLISAIYGQVQADKKKKEETNEEGDDQ